MKTPVTPFQMRILQELKRRPNGMGVASDIAPSVAGAAFRRTSSSRGAYCANVDRAALAMPEYVTRCAPKTRWDSPLLALTDAGLERLSLEPSP